MRKLFLMFASALLAWQASGQGVNFQALTPAQAVAKAKAENKYVFVDVYTDWCGPCKMMTAQVFPMKEMGDYFNPKYISLQLNAEKGEDGPEFAKKFGVKAYPTFIVLDGDGQLVHMFAGGVLDLTFIGKVEESFNPAKAFGGLKARYDAGERDPRFVASYLETLQNTHTADVAPMVEELYASAADQDKVSPEFLFIFDNARVWSGKDEFLTANRDRFREVAGREKVNEVFKRKYIGYYGQVLQGYDREATRESVAKTNARLASLGLADTDIFLPLQAASLVKVTGEGAGAAFETVKAVVPRLTDAERDTVLFYVTIGLKDLLTQEQKDQLVALVTSENTKGYIVRSITPR